MLVEKMFQIDGGKEYRGFSQNQYWNGWECPLFTLEVGKQIAEDMNAVTTDEKLVYDEATDSFVYQDSNYPEEEWDKFEATVIEGKKLYSIGGGSWVWDAQEIPT